jgi:hypothetical protein
MIMPVFAGVDALAAADAFGGIEKDRPWLTVNQSARRNQISVFFVHGIGSSAGNDGMGQLLSL